VDCPKPPILFGELLNPRSRRPAAAVCALAGPSQTAPAGFLGGLPRLLPLRPFCCVFGHKPTKARAAGARAPGLQPATPPDIFRAKTAPNLAALPQRRLPSALAHPASSWGRFPGAAQPPPRKAPPL
jgi:hypothetical protein